MLTWGSSWYGYTLSEPTKVEHKGHLVPVEEPATEALKKIRSQGRIFVLNQPLQIEVSRFVDGWCYESKPFAILAFGRSRREALDSFTEDFSVLWDVTAQAPDESLTIDAIAVKRAFQRLVRAVTAE